MARRGALNDLERLQLQWLGVAAFQAARAEFAAPTDAEVSARWWPNLFLTLASLSDSAPRGLDAPMLEAAGAVVLTVVRADPSVESVMPQVLRSALDLYDNPVSSEAWRVLLDPASEKRGRPLVR